MSSRGFRLQAEGCGCRKSMGGRLPAHRSRPPLPSRTPTAIIRRMLRVRLPLLYAVALALSGLVASAQSPAPFVPQPIVPGGQIVHAIPTLVALPEERTDRRSRGEQPPEDRARPDPEHRQHPQSVHRSATSSIRGINTGAAVILVAGGGHNTLNVGTEGADFVPFFYNYGVNTVILRNRLRQDGYNAETDAVNDAQQAIRMVRAHAEGVEHRSAARSASMGFSAGAELAAPAAIVLRRVRPENNDAPAIRWPAISSRPDFVGLDLSRADAVRARRRRPPIPAQRPAGVHRQRRLRRRGPRDLGGRVLRRVARSAHPQPRDAHLRQRRPPGRPRRHCRRTRNGTPFGTWQDRFIDWFRDLGFLGKPGVETKAAKDTATFVTTPPAAK